MEEYKHGHTHTHTHTHTQTHTEYPLKRHTGHQNIQNFDKNKKYLTKIFAKNPIYI